MRWVDAIVAIGLLASTSAGHAASFYLTDSSTGAAFGWDAPGLMPHAPPGWFVQQGFTPTYCDICDVSGEAGAITVWPGFSEIHVSNSTNVVNGAQFGGQTFSTPGIYSPTYTWGPFSTDTTKLVVSGISGVTMQLSQIASPQQARSNFVTTWHDFISAAKNGPTEQDIINAATACVDNPNCDFDTIAREEQALNERILALGHAAGVASVGLALSEGPPITPIGITLDVALNVQTIASNAVSITDIVAGKAPSSDNGVSLSSFSATENELEAGELKGKLIMITEQLQIIDEELQNIQAGDSFYSAITIDGETGYGYGTILDAVDPPGYGTLDIEFDAFIPDAIGAIPEPSTWVMFIVGFGAIGFGLRRRRKAAAT